LPRFVAEELWKLRIQHPAEACARVGDPHEQPEGA
jgi:hypothetical protein